MFKSIPALVNRCNFFSNFNKINSAKNPPSVWSRMMWSLKWNLTRQQVFLLSLMDILFSVGNLSECTKFVENMTKAALEESFMKHKIIPDVIDDPPKHPLEVLFFYGLVPGFGNKLPARQLTDPPHLIRWPADTDYEDPWHYSLVLVGLDEPSVSDASEREFLFWMLTNIPGPVMMRREIRVQWLPPNPGKGTGLHRYVFIMFEHAKRIAFKGSIQTVSSTDRRRKRFSTRHFAKKYNLGKPFAGNFFYSEWNESDLPTLSPDWEDKLMSELNEMVAKKRLCVI